MTTTMTIQLAPIGTKHIKIEEVFDDEGKLILCDMFINEDWFGSRSNLREAIRIIKYYATISSRL